VVLVGKATDYSGFGGAAFSSGILGVGDEDAQKGAVQVPDPFLKSVIIRATDAVFAELRRQDLEVGFKDLGAGGLSCASSEMGDAAGTGVEVSLDAVHVAMQELPPHVIACAETQERLLWVVPPSFTPTLMAIYNEQFDLPGAAEGAQACVVGHTRADDRYVLTAGCQNRLRCTDCCRVSGHPLRAGWERPNGAVDCGAASAAGPVRRRHPARAGAARRRLQVVDLQPLRSGSAGQHRLASRRGRTPA